MKLHYRGMIPGLKNLLCLHLTVENCLLHSRYLGFQLVTLEGM